MRPGKASLRPAKCFWETDRSGERKSRQGRRRRVKELPCRRRKRQSSFSTCSARYRRGTPLRRRICKGRDRAATPERDNFGYRASIASCPRGKASVVLPARPNQKAMARGARRRPFPLRLAAGQGGKESRLPGGRTK